MSARIITKRVLIPGKTSLLVLSSPQIAVTAKPGNFIILRVHAQGERIPLTIADTDPVAGTITIVFLVVGCSTAELNLLNEGDVIPDVCGPLGKPTHIEKKGTVVCVGGGTGVAAMHHIAKGHYLKGNKVISVIGARTKDLLLFHDELSRFSAEVLVATDDGSMGMKGMVTDALKSYLARDSKVTEVVAVGPVPMMAAVAEVTRPLGIPTVASLNTIMVDGIGMCGACRCSVDGEIRFACVDGPEFDAHKVDFAELRSRLSQFREQECHAMECHCKKHPEGEE